jgi:acetylornithine/succinyldiaminopimelate/putrescine aminotransferase/predicted amino acid dehydrogenase
MTAHELLTDLRQRGVRLWVEGADLRFSAPKGALGSGTTELLTRHKAELVALLRPTPTAVSQRTNSNPKSQSFSLDEQVIELSEVHEWRLEDQEPYVRYVAPYKGFLYQRMALDKKFVRGEGCHLYDEAGNRFADFIAQFGAVPFGHDPAPIWEAISSVRERQQPNLVITSISAAAGELAERLLAIAPEGLHHVVFTNSGAEAIEAAIKLARCRTGRVGILSTRDGFHGLTLAGMSATGRDFFQRGFGAPVLGFNYVPFGDTSALEIMLQTRPDFFAAFVVEIIQGESGIHVAPPGYLKAVADLCHRYGVLLIVDEVQTGLGRTGALFACEQEGVTPDILALAKALGGGLMPIGACLYTRSVYTEQFDLRHGSTLAGNTLACRAALATIEQLTKDDQRLVKRVHATGERLQQQLRALQTEYPALVTEIRGRGLMLGLDLNLEHVARTQGGMLAIMQEHGVLLYIVVSYLLNVERIRIAPSFTHGTVLRIEPPLVVDREVCDRLIDALRRTLEILERGDAGELLAHLMPVESSASRPKLTAPARQHRVPSSVSTPCDKRRARFAFVVHLLSSGDLRRFDPTLAPFADDALEALRSRISQFVKPFPHGQLSIETADGSVAEGELIVLPKLPAELLALQGHVAVDLVQSAVDLAVDRGAEVVGLGGFSSIVADGGLPLRRQSGLRVTSGNSLTTWAAARAVEIACANHGLTLADSVVAVVGAAGAIGLALSLFFAERAAKLILVGNPRAPASSLTKLRKVAEDCRRHITAGKSLSSPHEVANTQPAKHAAVDIVITTDIDRDLPSADVVVTATNAIRPFVASHHLRQRALICDVSRPLNISPDLIAARPDLRLASGGLVRAPKSAVLGHIEEPGQHEVLMACAAETIVLALSGHQSSHLCGPLDIDTIYNVGRLADGFGFSVVS